MLLVEFFWGWQRSGAREITGVVCGFLEAFAGHEGAHDGLPLLVC